MKFCRYKRLLPVVICAATLAACNSGTTASSAATATTQTAYVTDNGIRPYENNQSLHNAPAGLPNVYQYAKIDGQFTYIESVAGPNGVPFIAPTSVAFNNGYVYIVDDGGPGYGESSAIYIYAAAANGNLTYTGESASLPNGDAAEAIGFNGNYAYVADWESGGIWQYTIGTNGTLVSPVQVAPVGGFNNSNAGSLSINNGYIYTTCNSGTSTYTCPNNDIVEIYQIQSDGSAVAIESQTYIGFGQGGGSAANVVFVNGLAYITGVQTSILFSYTVEPDGSLTPNNYYSFNGDGLPYQVTTLFQLGSIESALYISGRQYSGPYSYMVYGYNVGVFGIPDYNPAYDLPIPPVAVASSNPAMLAGSIATNY